MKRALTTRKASPALSVPTGPAATAGPGTEFTSRIKCSTREQVRKSSFVGCSFRNVNHRRIQPGFRVGDADSIQVRKYEGGEQSRALVAIEKWLILDRKSTRLNSSH